MGTRDPRIDDYIGKSAEFAQPILTHLREVVHAACPDVEETLKWGMPYFVHHGMLCGMAAFKQHATFTFWKGSLVVEGHEETEKAMGQFGRITSVKDLPSRKVLSNYVKKAAKLNEEGTSAPRAKSKRPDAEPEVPAELTAALRGNTKARRTFEAFSPSHRREYVEWISEAKREETRARRAATAVEWLSEGKSRNWKYERPR